MLLKKENPHGGDIYRKKIRLDFSANTAPLGTPKAVKEAVRLAAEELTPYPDPYCQQLRQGISAYEGVSVDQVICGNGAAELIYAYARGVKPRKTLIVTPTFCEYGEALERAGCQCVEYPLQGDFRLDEGILTAITPKIDLVVICNPNNPTGVLYPITVMKQVLSRCEATDTQLFVDECFLDLVTDSATESLSGMISASRHLFILKAFTKSYGMAGVRLGYGLCGNPDLMEQISAETQLWNVSTLAQKAGLAALGCQAERVENIAIIKKERPKIQQALTACGFRVYPSVVNFILFQGDEGVADRLMKKGIQIRRCGNFSGLDDTFYRTAVKSPTENQVLVDALMSMAKEGRDAVWQGGGRAIY